MYLGITLNRLDDYDNSCQAFEKSISLISNENENHDEKLLDNKSIMIIYLNYAITLSNNDEIEHAIKQFQIFETYFEDLDDEVKHEDYELLEQRSALMDLLDTKREL